MESPKEAACLLMDNGGRRAFPMVESYAEVVNKGKQKFGEEIWVQGVSEEALKNSKLLKKCLVGRWGDVLD